MKYLELAKQFIAENFARLQTQADGRESKYRISTSELVNKIFTFCELYSGVTLYKYQEQFSKRVIRSVLLNDGEELTALFSRQSGKSETISVTVGGLMIILPQLANMPLFADDPRLVMFMDGVWVGVFAPSQRQAQITYNRIRSRLQSDSALAVLSDPEFNLQFTTSNGQTCSLSNGSFVTAISASEGSNIEGESFKIIICEEAQDIVDWKIKKCLTGDTWILLADGTYRRLVDVVRDKKDEVVCFDEDMKNLIHLKPSEFYDNGVQETYRVELEDGSDIRATINHQFYTEMEGIRDFRTLEEISTYGFSEENPIRIAVPDALPYFAEPCKKDYQFGIIAGSMLGHGSLSCGNWMYTGTIRKTTELHETMKQYFGDYIVMVNMKFNEEKKLQTVMFGTPFPMVNPLEKCLNDIYDNRLDGQLSSKEFYLGFIKALFENRASYTVDGKNPSLYLCICASVCHSVKDMLLKFGVHCRISDGYISISNPLDLKRLRDIFKIKNHKLDELIEYTKYDTYEVPLDNMRFEKVVSIDSFSLRHTYCLKVDKCRNFIANNIVSSNSISPMGAAYNASMVKIGTSSTRIGDFYKAIERNRKEDEERKKKGIHKKNHFEYDCDVASKYNPRYARYVKQEKKRLGENSDEYLMAYKLKWIITRGMFIDVSKFEKENVDNYERVSYDKSATHVAGIDLGRGDDGTWITIVEVDWDLPVIMETRIDEDGEEVTYLAYNTYLKDWYWIKDIDDYEVQYPMILSYLSKWKLAKIVVDATKESSIAHRLRAQLPIEVVPFTFTPKSKSEMYKFLESEISSGRARVCGGKDTVETREYKEFIKQLGCLEKSYRGTYMVVAHGDEKDHDDAPDSWALAMFGTQGKTEINETETKDSRYLFGRNTPNKLKSVNRINKFTGRRR